AADNTTIGGADPGARNTVRFNGGLSVYPPPSADVFANNTLTPNRDEVPDLAVSIAAPSSPAAGQPFAVVVTVTNRGFGPASDATAGLLLPAGATALAATASQGAAVAVGGGAFALLGPVAAGGSATMTVLVTTPGSGGPLTLGAAASGGRFEI